MPITPPQRSRSGRTAAVPRRAGRAAAALLAAVVLPAAAACGPAGTETSAPASATAPAPEAAAPLTEPSTSSTSPVPPATPAAPTAEPSPPDVPEEGDGTWTYAAGGDTAGDEGRGVRYRVAVEDGTGQDAAAFAAFVAETYADPRGWTAGDRYRFERVAADEPADYTVYLASPVTRGVLCEDPDDTFTSCRIGDRVVVNLARWLLGVDDYGAPLETYRRYVVNHESGHALTYTHELCPGDGELAPVMEQQTLGLHGCVANAWPYPDGRELYSGPPGAY